MITPFAALAFLAVGLALGLLGGGGSILAIPALVNVMGIDPKMAVPMALPVVGCTALAGVILRWRAGHLHLREAAPFIAIAALTSFVAARVGTNLPDTPRMIAFAVIMLAAAVAMWRRATAHTEAPHAVPVRSLPALYGAAIGVGIVTGTLGVGGGFLIVPALTGVLGIPMAEATGTSLAVIPWNTAAASVGYLERVDLDWGLTGAVTAAALLGMFLGTRLAPKTSPQMLARAFAILLVVLSGFTLWQHVG